MKKLLILASSFLVIVIISLLTTKLIMVSKQNQDKKQYVNYEYGISLQYDSTWERDDRYMDRFGGENGFFQINAFDGEAMDIDQVANHQVSHQLVPYGSNPTITALNIDGQEARLIIPSEDQEKEFDNQAELIVTYPKPKKIRSEEYYYFILYADKYNIENIAKTIEFIK